MNDESAADCKLALIGGTGTHGMSENIIYCTDTTTLTTQAYLDSQYMTFVHGR